MKSNQPFDIFISYARKDFDEVSAIKRQIETQIPDLNCWFDLTGIESGEQFSRQIVSAIDNSEIVLFFLSQASLSSYWTEKEVRYARNKKKRVIPILLKGAKLDGWFLFEFGDTDCIDSTNRLQMQKLFSNLSSWSGKPQKKVEKTKMSKPSAPVQPAEEKIINKDEPISSLDPKGESKSKKKLFRFLTWAGISVGGVFATILAIFVLIFVIGFVSALIGCEGEKVDVPPADTTFTVIGVSFGMNKVEGGEFLMGATSEQGDETEEFEKPVHKVELDSYWIGQTEVTHELWQAVMGSNPSKHIGSKKPVEQVSWDDCQEFIRRLNNLTGEKFRLPTEAEWEFAARGGNKSKGFKYSGGDSLELVAWFDDNSDGETHLVAQKLPNELGLYDLSGNVWEWCADWFDSYENFAQSNPTGPQSGLERVIRGGGWQFDSDACRISFRNCLPPSENSISIGLRLAL